MSVRQNGAVIAGGGIAVWGGIIGTLSDQTDLNNALAGKANTGLSNITNAGKAVCANMSMPSDRYIDLTLGASGSTYTAPADGYFACYSSNVCNTIIRNIYYNIGSTVVGAAGFVNFNTFPVKKGDVVVFSYSTTIDTWRFYYAQGAQ